MLKVSLGIFLVACVTLMLELVLIRVFDVILYPNIAYMVITCAMFCLGLAGVYRALRPFPDEKDVRDVLPVIMCIWAISTIALLPLLNFLPFDYNKITVEPVIQILAFMGAYLALGIPFFLSGLVFTMIFSAYPRKIQSLYFWDLTGAGVGCVIIVPFLSAIGPGGLLFCASALALLASALFSRRTSWSTVAVLGGVILLAIPFAYAPQYFDFKEHMDKRGVKEAREMGNVELTRWDPVAKIDIIPATRTRYNRENVPHTNGAGQSLNKHIAYDGGSQSSRFYPFDGDYDKLRNEIQNGKEDIRNHFWFWGVLASHYLKQDQEQRVLIIGSAGGQETKAALAYGASHVDAIEMVETVVRLGKTRYADYIGNLFTHPNVQATVGEGRSFLRASKERYDIIQIFSNYTSSSIASGSGAMNPNYLQTLEAYKEYFGHLSENGILHMNHHVYPRMITTAARAWKQLGFTDFQKHVVVFERADRLMDNLPTVLIKMQPWTESELDKIMNLVGVAAIKSRLVENPLQPEESFLSSDFYNGSLPDGVESNVPFQVLPTTDNQPFFNFLRKYIDVVNADPQVFLNSSTAGLLNSQLRQSVPMDIIHLIVTGGVSIFFAALFILLPLWFSDLGKTNWPMKKNAIVYFSCLGAGFIILELIFIHIFMKLIGYPLYTYSTVIFTLLLAAGIGSLSSSHLNVTVTHRWIWPFAGIGIMGGLILFIHPFVFDIFMASQIWVRILVTSGLLFPIGFFLGMPFPLGILAIEGMPQGAVAWAWGLNGLFTVVGGLLSVLLSIYFGFQVTCMIALTIYLLAFAMFRRLRSMYIG